MATQTRNLEKISTKTTIRNKKKPNGLKENEVAISRKTAQVSVKRNAFVDINNVNFSTKLNNNNVKCATAVVHVNNSVKLKNINITNKSKIAINNKLVKFKKKQSKVEEEINIDGIENVDELYRNHVFLTSEYAQDVYNYLRTLEVKYKIIRWPLNEKVNAEMRAMLIDWLIDVHMEYKLLPESLHLAVSLVDRYLQNSTKVTVNNLQLIGICCMSIASKYEEVHLLSILDFLYLCDDTYEKEEFLEMESAILRAVDFQVGRPLSINFLRRYSLVGKAGRIQHNYGKYMLDLALFESTLCHIRPSLLAASAFFISICLVNGNVNPSYWNKQLTFYSKYYFNNFKPLISKLSKLALDCIANHYPSVKKKYTLEEFEEVSKRIELKKNLLRTLSEI